MIPLVNIRMQFIANNQMTSYLSGNAFKPMRIDRLELPVPSAGKYKMNRRPPILILLYSRALTIQVAVGNFPTLSTQIPHPERFLMRKRLEASRVRAWLGLWKRVGVEQFAQWRPRLHHFNRASNKFRVTVYHVKGP